MGEIRKAQVQRIRNARAAFIKANYPEGTKSDRIRANAVLDRLAANSSREELDQAYED